jgi:AraC-like DNA-binding protein
LRLHLSRRRAAEARRVLPDVVGTGERRADSARSAGALRLATSFEPARGGLAPWRRRRIEAYVQARLAQPLRVDELAEQASLSVSYFHRAFKETFGQTPHAYVTRLRVELAQELMLDTMEPLIQIALASGFASHSHFATVFVRQVGEAPAAWRRRNLAERDAQARRQRAQRARLAEVN